MLTELIVICYHAGNHCEGKKATFYFDARLIVFLHWNLPPYVILVNGFSCEGTPQTFLLMFFLSRVKSLAEMFSYRGAFDCFHALCIPLVYPWLHY